MNFEEERERIKLHRIRALELLGKEEFPIYKVANTRFFEKDLVPQCLAGYDFYMKNEPVHGINPTDPITIINQYISQGEFLTDLSLRQSEVSYADSPCISWTVDREVVNYFKNLDYYQEYGYLIIESIGRLLSVPEKPEDLIAVRSNEGFYIPVLSKMYGNKRPGKEIEFQKEFVTFGIFPKEKYKILESNKLPRDQSRGIL